MACWKCECGFRNCDHDECQNPKCPYRCHICGTHTKSYMKNEAGLRKPVCQSCRDGDVFRHFEIEFTFVAV